MYDMKGLSFDRQACFRALINSELHTYRSLWFIKGKLMNSYVAKDESYETCGLS